MKVKTVSLTDKTIERRDYCDAFGIFIDGKKVFRVHDGEHEDNSLGRNFSDCFGIPELMRKAWEAGKNGESFELEDEKVEEF